LEKLYLIGIDSGSSQCKGALLCAKKDQDLVEHPTVLATAQRPSGYQPERTAQALVYDLFGELSIKKTAVPDTNFKLAATGYGRERIKHAVTTATEITTHGLGASFLLPSTSTVIDIGGQDSKVIRLQNGRVRSFEMNDKCAAGTGRFLEMACRLLGIELGQLDQYALSETPTPINSMCAVFAESELIGLLNSGARREDILCGVLTSIATRVVNMAYRAGASADECLLFTGGLSRSKAMLQALQRNTGFHTLQTVPLAPYAGAIGAALTLQKADWA
jgi:predicted CoA-substrate-specific enzyme activase